MPVWHAAGLSFFVLRSRWLGLPCGSTVHAHILPARRPRAPARLIPRRIRYELPSLISVSHFPPIIPCAHAGDSLPRSHQRTHVLVEAAAPYSSDHACPSAPRRQSPRTMPDTTTKDNSVDLPVRHREFARECSRTTLLHARTHAVLGSKLLPSAAAILRSY